jgi:hypothetical protein
MASMGRALSGREDWYRALHYLYQGGAESVVYPGTVLEVTTLERQYEISEQAPSCPTVDFEFELYAEDMENVSRTLNVSQEEFLSKLIQAIRRFA